MGIKQNEKKKITKTAAVVVNALVNSLERKLKRKQEYERLWKKLSERDKNERPSA